MAGERVGGKMGLGAAGQPAGTFATAGGDSRATPPPEQSNPSVFATAGVHLFGIPAGVTSIVVEQWGGGGPGEQGTSNTGGHGGGGGAYAKYTLGGALIVQGGIVSVLVGVGGTPNSGGGESYAKAANPSVYVNSDGGGPGSDAGLGGTNTVHAGSGLTVTTDTAGAAGKANSGQTGGAGGAAGGTGGGAGGAGGASGANGKNGSAPGGGGGATGATGAFSLTPGAGGAGKVSISWTPPA